MNVLLWGIIKLDFTLTWHFFYKTLGCEEWLCQLEDCPILLKVGWGQELIPLHLCPACAGCCQGCWTQGGGGRATHGDQERNQCWVHLGEPAWLWDLLIWVRFTEMSACPKSKSRASLIWVQVCDWWVWYLCSLSLLPVVIYILEEKRREHPAGRVNWISLSWQPPGRQREQFSSALPGFSH